MQSSRPVTSLLVTGGRFLQILDLFKGLKIGVPSGCQGATSIFKIVTINDVTLWLKVESTWQVYTRFYYRAMRCISAVFAVTQCLSVRLSVCPSRS